MLKWKVENYQLLKRNYGAYEEVEKEFYVWISDIIKKQEENSFIFPFYRRIFEIWVREVAAITDTTGTNFEKRKLAFRMIGTLPQ